MTEHDIISNALRSMGYSNPQESYQMMIKHAQDRITQEIKSREISKEELSEVFTRHGLEDSEKALLVAREVEALVRTKFGIPKV